jgi:hypothetical protein
MAVRQQVGELLTGHRERDREGQVLQQLQRCRHSVLLVGIAARHQPQAVPLRRFGAAHSAADLVLMCIAAMSSILLTEFP